MDTTDDSEGVNVAPGSAVVVTATALDPIAKVGQLVLLASPEYRVEDGDLVAVTTAAGRHLLRRIWSDGMRWILQGINPVVPTPCVVIAKAEAAFRKIVGVVFVHPAPHSVPPAAGANEWMPVDSPVAPVIRKLKAITVVGDSLEPIASTGQRVLIGAKHEGDARHLKGNLAVLETDDPNIGNVITRLYPRNPNWLLESVNPIDPHDPLSVPVKSIRAIWPLHGVLYQDTGTEE